VVSERVALAESRQRYEGIIDELGESLAEFNERTGNNFRSEDRADMWLWNNERDCGTTYPGLDVHDTAYRTRALTKNGIVTRTRGEERVLITTACGCIHETLHECFPEFRALIPWHLNTMRPSEDGKAWVVEELPDSVLSTIQSLILTDDERRAA
jgi:hypothetical protein